MILVDIATITILYCLVKVSCWRFDVEHWVFECPANRNACFLCLIGGMGSPAPREPPYCPPLLPRLVKTGQVAYVILLPWSGFFFQLCNGLESRASRALNLKHPNPLNPSHRKATSLATAFAMAQT